MNNKRRKKINEIITSTLTNIDFVFLQNKIEKILDEEQETFDNLPESLQYTTNGEKSEEAIYLLEEALEYIEEYLNSSIDNKTNKEVIEETIDSIINCLKDAII